MAPAIGNRVVHYKANRLLAELSQDEQTNFYRIVRILPGCTWDNEL
jgi:hypothetical protein